MGTMACERHAEEFAWARRTLLKPHFGAIFSIPAGPPGSFGPSVPEIPGGSVPTRLVGALIGGRKMAFGVSDDEFGVEITYPCRRCGAEGALRGEQDLATAPLLQEHLSELVVSQGWIDITLDIAELRFLDSIGLSVLIMTQKRVEEMGGSLVVHYPTKAALKLFDTTGLTARLMGTAGRAPRAHHPGSSGDQPAP